LQKHLAQKEHVSIFEFDKITQHEVVEG